MSSQVFKEAIPINILFDLLDEICTKHNNHYLLSKTSFQKAKFHNLIVPFCDNIKKYYHNSKTYYTTRSIDYNKFITIIRQICRLNNISYASKICYNKSTYDILYYIYKPTN